MTCAPGIGINTVRIADLPKQSQDFAFFNVIEAPLHGTDLFLDSLAIWHLSLFTLFSPSDTTDSITGIYGAPHFSLGSDATEANGKLPTMIVAELSCL